jgi:MFS family permease
MDRGVVETLAKPDGDVPRRASGMRALGSRPFRWYFAGQVVSASGTFLQQTAIGWLVLGITGSPASLGLVLAAGGVPQLVAGPWGGVVADRFDLRRLLIATQAIQAALALALWLMAWQHALTVPVLISISLVGGLVQVVDSPARQAFVPQLVPADALASAMSLNGVVMNSARVVGPAVAGLLITTVGTTPCFLVNAASYLFVIVALVILRPLAQVARHGTPGGLREGLAHARSRPQLWLPLAMMGLVGLLAFNFPVVLPVLAKQTFHGTGGTYSLMTVVLSAGSVVGSLGVGLIPHPKKKYLVITVFAFAASLAGTALAPNLLIAYPLLALTGATGFAFVTLCSTTLQLHADPQFRGRIMALWVFVFLGTTPIGSVLLGWVCGVSGARAGLLVGAVGAAVAGFGALRVRTPPGPEPDGAATAGQPR